MAKATNTRLFLGEDHQFVFTTLNAAETAAIDVSGWTLSWMLKRAISDADLSALLEKTTLAGIAITGVYNSVPSLNTQVATVTILDTDTTALPEVLAHYELKRMDAGFETVLAYGTLELVRAVHA